MPVRDRGAGTVEGSEADPGLGPLGKVGGQRLRGRGQRSDAAFTAPAVPVPPSGGVGGAGGCGEFSVDGHGDPRCVVRGQPDRDAGEAARGDRSSGLRGGGGEACHGRPSPTNDDASAQPGEVASGKEGKRRAIKSSCGPHPRRFAHFDAPTSRTTTGSGAIACAEHRQIEDMGAIHEPRRTSQSLGAPATPRIGL